jgi:hypothetical protein
MTGAGGDDPAALPTDHGGVPGKAFSAVTTTFSTEPFRKRELEGVMVFNAVALGNNEPSKHDMLCIHC